VGRAKEGKVKTKLQIIGLSFLIPTVAFGQGTILWDESVNGPLSNNPGSPSLLGGLGPGSSFLYAASERIPFEFGWYVTNDFFTFSVPIGLQVTSIQLETDRPIWTWIGDESFSAQLGFVIDPSNGQLLPQWGFASLSAGTYGMYLSNDDLQSSLTTANYRLNVFVEVVPEPSAFSFFLFGAGLVGLRCCGKVWLRPK